MFEKTQRDLDLTLDQGVADEDFMGLPGVDGAVGDGPLRDDHQPVKADLLKGTDLSTVFLPAGFRID